VTDADGRLVAQITVDDIVASSRRRIRRTSWRWPASARSAATRA
jgi:hypothetical protein